MLFLVAGASGSGKSAVLPFLVDRLPDIEWHDFDELGVPEQADKTWRHQTTETWVATAVRNQVEGRDTGLVGGAILGEVLACPSATLLVGVAACLLDCHDLVRVERLNKRGDNCASQDMLNWAAWQRMHAIDPHWRQDVISTGGWSEMDWSRWSGWKRGDPRWRTAVIDTSGVSIEAVAYAIVAWIKASRDGSGSR